jgi:hypothetical protein
MDLDLPKVDVRVTAVDDRTLLSPEVMEAVVTEVMARMERRRSSAASARDEAALWPSVRARGER